jgi:hypothetical protein
MKIFEQTFVATEKTHKTTTVLVSFVVQTILVIIGILIPMIYFDALPTAQLHSLLVAPPHSSTPASAAPARTSQARQDYSASVRRRSANGTQGNSQECRPN